ncbi:MAG: AmmeMemoRadiSam system radical SAM enzyme [Candidatus Omnitrophica bacterium]|nr:AmmeMemoRadiSam system radical SAM enzyme [Candidatus Omnitrophota bacterium]MBD3268732.1 AmmeMemoRadiSam system radical SAM enzyme [Candidatus Omnitrophota bacterium]
MLKEASFYEKLDNNTVRCFLCRHSCTILLHRKGLCGVRENREGKLYTLVYARPVASNADPIEKKPLYHFLPGTYSYSIATKGCNFKCSFCQNWQISQADEAQFLRGSHELQPQLVVKKALSAECKSIAYTYTEPTIFFEYAYDTAVLAKEKGLANVFVTNGYMERAPLKSIKPYLDAANVDLKSFNEDFYVKECAGRLKPVLENIRLMKDLGIWVEITTLIIPGSNDSPDEIENLAAFIADVDPGIPWHISRFHPDYKNNRRQSTPVAILNKAKEIGEAAGLKYIYIGNIAGDNSTYCPGCGNKVIERSYFGINSTNLKGKKCSFCSEEIPGVF